MKKFVVCLLFLLLPTFIFSGCAKEIDYNEYVSEKRTNVYLYESDTLNLKIYASEKETPYLLDGIKGKTNPIIEIFAEFLSGWPLSGRHETTGGWHECRGKGVHVHHWWECKSVQPLRQTV